MSRLEKIIAAFKGLKTVKGFGTISSVPEFISKDESITEAETETK